MSFRIRPFTPDDYPALTFIGEAAYPGTPYDANLTRYEDEHRPAHLRYRRWIAEADGGPVGTGHYVQLQGRYHPRKFHLYVTVHPAYQRRGIGSALYQTLRETLAPYDPIGFQTRTREDLLHGIRFIEQRGYTEVLRNWELVLDLAGFDPARWQPALDRAAATGIQIRSLKELESDPDRDRKLYDVLSATRVDIPATEPPTPLGFGYFVQRTFQNPGFLPEGYSVAVAPSGEYVGLSVLWKDSGDGVLYTGLTGVRREYRSRGIALALKVRAATWAKQAGKKGINTAVSSTNGAMLAINERLGYVRRPAWIEYGLTLHSAGEMEKT